MTRVLNLSTLPDSFVDDPAFSGPLQSGEMLEILDCGLVAEGDCVIYPDEGTVLLRLPGQRLVFRQSDALQSWTPDPHAG